MSKLGCACGHTIRDQTDHLPYKGRVLPELHCDDFFDWMAEEAQSYVVASREGQTPKWLLDRGYTQDYIDLKLSDSEVLHDHIHTRFLKLKRDMYECSNCGRIHLEKNEINHFVSYTPDNQKRNAILSAERAE